MHDLLPRSLPLSRIPLALGARKSVLALAVAAAEFLYSAMLTEVEVERFLSNCGSQFLFLGNHATRIGSSIPEESWFTIPIFGESYHL